MQSMKHILESFGASFSYQRVNLTGPFRHLKVALIADELTRSCLAFECQVRDLTPLNAHWVLKFWKPDLLLVESAWEGRGNAWKYKIAAYPDRPDGGRARRSVGQHTAGDWRPSSWRLSPSWQ